MDESLRLIERRISEAPDEMEIQKLRLSQWRAGFKIEPIPGDVVEIKGYSEQTRGVFIKKWRGIATFNRVIGGGILRPLNPNRQWNGNPQRFTCWFLKNKDQICRYLCLGFKLLLIQPLIPGNSPPEEAKLSGSKLFDNSVGVNLKIVPLRIFRPSATLQYGLDSIPVNIEPRISIATALEDNAEQLGIDLDRITNSHNQSMFSDPTSQRIVYRNDGKVISPSTILEEGKFYVINIVYQMKGG